MMKQHPSYLTLAVLAVGISAFVGINLAGQAPRNNAFPVFDEKPIDDGTQTYYRCDFKISAVDSERGDPCLSWELIYESKQHCADSSRVLLTDQAGVAHCFDFRHVFYDDGTLPGSKPYKP
jgi:hypothetical protein